MKAREVIGNVSGKLEAWCVAKPKQAARVILIASIGWACASLAWLFAIG